VLAALIAAIEFTHSRFTYLQRVNIKPEMQRESRGLDFTLLLGKKENLIIAIFMP
jgi:hypothetical protein